MNVKHPRSKATEAMIRDALGWIRGKVGPIPTGRGKARQTIRGVQNAPIDLAISWAMADHRRVWASENERVATALEIREAVSVALAKDRKAHRIARQVSRELGPPPAIDLSALADPGEIPPPPDPLGPVFRESVRRLMWSTVSQPSRLPTRRPMHPVFVLWAMKLRLREALPVLEQQARDRVIAEVVHRRPVIQCAWCHEIAVERDGQVCQICREQHDARGCDACARIEAEKTAAVYRAWRIAQATGDMSVG